MWRFLKVHSFEIDVFYSYYEQFKFAVQTKKKKTFAPILFQYTKNKIIIYPIRLIIWFSLNTKDLWLPTATDRNWLSKLLSLIYLDTK